MSARNDFWSRRKAAVAAEAEAEVKARAAEDLAEDHAALEEKSDEEILAELELPDPDSLQQGDDFSAFLAQRVPERIRRRALRKLWVSNPVLANLDELVEYGEDYTDAATVVENMQTVYEVGKGIVKKLSELDLPEEETAKDAPEPDELAKDDAPEARDEPAALAEAEPLPDPDPGPAPGSDCAPGSDPAHDPEPEPAGLPTRRRMRFAFAE